MNDRRIEVARGLMAEAIEHGCVPSEKGNWVVFTPPPPVDLLMELVNHGDEIAAIYRESKNG